MPRLPPYIDGDESPEWASFESKSSFDLSTEDPQSQLLHSSGSSPNPRNIIFSSLRSLLYRLVSVVSKLSRRWRRNRHRRTSSTSTSTSTNKLRGRWSGTWRICIVLQIVFGASLLLTLFTAIALPSYSSPPPRYRELRNRAKSSREPGRANAGVDKVFIAASIFDRDGSLAGGAWGGDILSLVDLLGPSNVFLSIYANGAGPLAKSALKRLEEKTTCEHAIVFEDELDPTLVPKVELPDGTKWTRRIAYLAEVRNQALRPLSSAGTRYDKLLYLNDVVFDPIEAAQLLFATNAGSGKPQYRAACSLDFINPFKFYDTFAARDLEGFSMGLPLYPWFSSAGNAQSRKDVLHQNDAVRVRSCWGGMVAFDARFFQSTPEEFDDLDVAGSMNGTDFVGFRFRAEKDLFWEAAECCLIHADIQEPVQNDTGIYMNPYVRVAYDTRTLSWLWLSRRIERLHRPFQYLVNTVVGLPWYNPRRSEQPWQEVQEQVWVPNPSLPKGGSFKLTDRIADHAGFCGVRGLQVLRANPGPGEKTWEFIPAPST